MMYLIVTLSDSTSKSLFFTCTFSLSPLHDVEDPCMCVCVCVFVCVFTFNPNCAPLIAATYPPGPAPITIKSNAFVA